jgi:ATP-dependent Lon protease
MPDNKKRPKRVGKEPMLGAETDERDVRLNIEPSETSETLPNVPQELPILPLRGLVVYPQTAMPLNIGQPRSVRLVDDVVAGDQLIGLVASKNPDLESPDPKDIYEMGTMASVLRLFRTPDGTIRLLVQGIARVRVVGYTQTEPYLRAKVVPIPENSERGIEVEALMRNVIDQFTRLADLVPSIPAELINSALNLDDPLQLVYAIATYIRLSIENYQKILELDSVTEKLRLLMTILGKEIDVLELGRKIQNDAQTAIEQMQKEYFLREQIKAIRRELGEEDDQAAEIEDFREKIEAAQMPEESYREALRELDRMSRLPSAAAEYGVIRTYLDWMTSYPWQKRTADNLDINNARKVLDEDHYGLSTIKERILEFLAVRRLRKERYGKASNKGSENRSTVRRDREGVILLFIGPPGVGKTSLGASIARAMDRKFTRLSLGGVRDEAEIRGFRRTYIGAMPGRIIQTMRRMENNNPVIMLDEIDKMGRDFRGDPAAALLEVLDPEQNHEFRDHYLDVAVNLSEVIFITTANEIDGIPGPLLDRMEVISLSGYTELEKLQIAKQYLVRRQVRENGLLAKEVSFSDEALQLLIRDYTREAGVRNLERQIGGVVRKVAIKIAAGDRKRMRVTEETVREMLGKPRFGYREEMRERTEQPGVATGLSVTIYGGDVLFVEATQMPGAKGFQYTGQLGEVMQESARTAFSYIRSHAADYGVSADYFEKHDIHLHVPAGATPKDGPSAGVTMATALVSLLTGRPVRSNVAMTGEITLRGQVLPVGGIKDKVLAAHRFGADTVILPGRNRPDVDEVPEDVRQDLTIILVDRVEEVLAAALTPPTKAEKAAANPREAKQRKAHGRKTTAKRQMRQSKAKP